MDYLNLPNRIVSQSSIQESSCGKIALISSKQDNFDSIITNANEGRHVEKQRV